MNTYLYSSTGEFITGTTLVYVADAGTGQPIGRITVHPRDGVTARFVPGPGADVDGPLYYAGTTQRLPGIVGLGRFERRGDPDEHAAIDRAHHDIQRRWLDHQGATQGVSA